VTAGTAFITVDGTEEELRSLANWLRDEDDLRGRVGLSAAPIQEGHMGGAFEAITAVLTGTTVNTLITAIKDWSLAKRAVGNVTLKLKSGSGRELELTCGSATDTQVVLDSARKFIEEGS
jgi:membrane-associated two-gene conflict system component 1 (EACC1)